ncbi:hypothetical protein ACN6A1_34160 [Myxococcus virescens]|uniref:hypothetical protein n=1 Tax=Myxococcus virescens TaxID=83456 RepID=UPI003DA330C9
MMAAPPSMRNCWYVTPVASCAACQENVGRVAVSAPSAGACYAQFRVGISALLLSACGGPLELDGIVGSFIPATSARYIRLRSKADNGGLPLSLTELSLW